MMSSHNKRPDLPGRNEEHASGGGDKRRWCRNKHLYLVVDDWVKGFSIHKIDPDRFHSDDEEHRSSAGHRHLPEPPALRLEPPAARGAYYPPTDMSFTALGTKMFAFMNQRCGLVYDTETAVLSVGPHAPAEMIFGYGVSVAVGEVLYALSYRYFDGNKPNWFAAMSWVPTVPDIRQQPTEGWLWKTLPQPPFDRCVGSYTLHPNGRTIFMTSADHSFRTATYSFDTVDSAWRFHGNWSLPFDNQGYFDGELDAWVGLNRDGYMCSCPVISPSFTTPEPCTTSRFYPDNYKTTYPANCKTTEENIFSKKGHMRASLTYMGASKFCLVERVVANPENPPTHHGANDGIAMRLTMFGLKYNHRGELQIKDHRPTYSFLSFRNRYDFLPQAFWM